MGSPPEATARGTPEGIKLEDGFSSLVTFSSDPTVELWEIEVTPPGLDGGDPVDTSTMHNSVFRTKAPRQLIDLTEMSFPSAYDPEAYDTLLNHINVKQTITVTFPDASTLAFFGYLQRFETDALAEGTMPQATCTIIPTNADPTDGSEQAPVLVEAAST